jgi:hypothetical protein
MITCWALEALDTEYKGAMDVPFAKKTVIWWQDALIGRINKALCGLLWPF